MSLRTSRLLSVRCDAPGCVDGHEDYLTSAKRIRTQLREMGWRCDHRTGDHCPRHRGPIDRVEMAP